MLVEGLMNKHYVEVMDEAGFIFDWEDEEQLKCAKESGLNVPNEFDPKDTYVEAAADALKGV